MFAIQTQGLRRSFSGRKGTVEAVRGVDLQVAEGQVYGFLGPNGAGKTTTLRMLATLLVPTAGEATVCGHDLRRDAERVRESIGYVSQSGGADQRATGRENLVLQARLFGISASEAAVRAADLVRRFRLEEFADRFVATYSGGQRRRLDLALGMVHRPRLLFLDEPTLGLDPQSRANLWDEVRGLRTLGTTVFVTTHYLDEADALCDRLAIIDDGRIVAEGTPSDLKRAIGGDIVTLGVQGGTEARDRAHGLLAALPTVDEIVPAETGDTLRLRTREGERLLPEILRTLDAHGLVLQTVALSRPSLDDVFLRQTGRSLRDE
jgi:ABC-2 type transport system ATP-binding protein